MPWYHSFRTRLDAALKAGGITKAKLADDAGIHVTTVSRIIHGHLEPSLTTAEKLAKAAGIAAEELFQEKTSPIRKRTLTGA